MKNEIRLLHTADWHLGAKLERHSRRPDTRTALAGLIARAKTERPDCILHAGDVWDSERPDREALRDGVEALSALAAVAPTIVACGNHDGRYLFEALEVLARAREERRLQFVTEPGVITLAGLEGSLLIAVLPWITDAHAQRLCAGSEGRRLTDYRPRLRRIAGKLGGTLEEDLLAAGRRDGCEPAAVLLTHGYRQGAVLGGSEREGSVLPERSVNGSAMPRCAYEAWGHIHQPQQTGTKGEAPGRYPGSLVPIDFSEDRECERGVVSVRLSRNGEGGWETTKVEQCANPRGRRLTVHDGPREDLMRRAAGGGLDECLLKACVRSDERIFGLAAELRTLSAGVLICEMINVVDNPARQGEAAAWDEAPEPPIGELYAAWRRDRKSRTRHADGGQVRLFERALQAAESKPGESERMLLLDPEDHGRRAAEALDALTAARLEEAGGGGRA